MLDCYKCAFKHISEAKRVFYELRHGYHSDPIHIAWFSGEMSCASSHLSARQPDLANALRDDRIRVFDEMVSSDLPPVFIPDFDGYIAVIYDLIRTESTKEKQ